MKHKFREGLVIAVLLLFVGLAVAPSINVSVLGNQNSESELKIRSPLFTIKTNKAVKKGEFFIKSNYIGNNSNNNMLLFHRDNDMVLIQELKKRIYDMDEKEFENLLLLIQKQLSKYKIKNLDKQILINSIVKLQKYLHKYNQLIETVNNFNKKDTPLYYTIGEPWYPGCFREFFSFVVTTILEFIYLLLSIIIPTLSFTCGPCPIS